ncbi:MAG: fibronectin type III domain-containing protein [Sphingobacteriaceae bacterium]|nr:fibronectin type III domain-containing protein [Sphingobacteriaceae bacterium]
MRLFCLYIFLFSLTFSIFAQNFEVRFFVKKDSVLFRLLPNSKADLDKYTEWPIQISRIDKNGNEKILLDKFYPYSIIDTAHWLPLIRKDKNKFGFTYQSLFGNVSKEKLPQQKAKDEKMMYEFLLLSCDFDREVAKACGLYFADNDFVSGQTYTYVLKNYTGPKNLKKFKEIEINTATLSAKKEMSQVSHKTKYNKMELNWDVKALQEFYSGFYVERSEDNIHYQFVHQQPLVFMGEENKQKKKLIFYRDTMPVLNKQYTYRVRGLNYFGEFSAPSNLINTIASQPIQSFPLFDSVEVLGNKDVYLKWRMDDTAETKFIQKFILTKCKTESGKYNTVAELANALNYRDTALKHSYYYKVFALTQAGDTLSSFSKLVVITDSIPPDVPKGLNGKCDRDGNITLQWLKPKDENLLGYKIFRVNALNEEPVQINSHFISDTVFNEKLALDNLSHFAYYAIAATDSNYNTSQLSPFIKIKKTDTIAPVKPILLGVSAKLNGVKLKYSVAQEEEILKHGVYRRTKNKKFEWIAALNSADTLNYMLDTTAVNGTMYGYVIKSKDESNNESVSNELFIFYESGFRPKIKDFNAEVDRKQKHILLSWNYEAKEIEKFIIYRQQKGKDIEILKTLEGKERTYKDQSPQMGNIYSFRIKAVMLNGTESLLSDVLVREY